MYNLCSCVTCLRLGHEILFNMILSDTAKLLARFLKNQLFGLLLIYLFSTLPAIDYSLEFFDVDMIAAV